MLPPLLFYHRHYHYYYYYYYYKLQDLERNLPISQRLFEGIMGLLGPYQQAAAAQKVEKFVSCLSYRTAARFTKYLTTILRLSYNNAKSYYQFNLHIRRTSNLRNSL